MMAAEKVRLTEIIADICDFVHDLSSQHLGDVVNGRAEGTNLHVFVSDEINSLTAKLDEAQKLSRRL